MNKGCLQTIALLFPGPVTIKYHLVFHHLCLYLQLVPLWDENSLRQDITPAIYFFPTKKLGLSAVCPLAQLS